MPWTAEPRSSGRSLIDDPVLVAELPNPTIFTGEDGDDTATRATALAHPLPHRTPWLQETGKGSKPRAVHIQLRPDPLAH